MPKIAVDLFQKVADAKTEAGLTTNEYVTQLLTEYYGWKENGGDIMVRKAENTRTLAFQIPEELFQHIKDYLERETKRRGRKVTQRDFVVGLIERALDEAEREAAGTEETAEDSPMGLVPDRNPARTPRTESLTPETRKRATAGRAPLRTRTADPWRGTERAVTRWRRRWPAGSGRRTGLCSTSAPCSRRLRGRRSLFRTLPGSGAFAFSRGRSSP